MSTDASGFSLEQAEKTIRPFIRDLSLRRLKDCISDSKDDIDGLICELKMWPAWTTITFNIDRDAKAYPIPLYRCVDRSPSDRMPREIEYGQLILYFPSGETIYWLFQKTVFTPQHLTDPYYNGASSIVWVNNDKCLGSFISGKGLVLDQVAERFWKSIGNLVSQSLKSADARQKSLETVSIACVTEYAKARAVTIIKETAPIREQLAVLESNQG